MNQDLKDLLSYYNRQPDPIMINRTFGLLAGLQDEKQKEVINWLLDHVPKKSGLDIPAIKNAMAEVGANAPGGEEHARPWTCDLCGSNFQRVTVSCDSLRRQGIHDYCPRCGLAPIETETAQAYASKDEGKTPAWYTRMKSDISKARLIPGARPRYDPKSDDAHDADMQRRKVERMKKEFREEAEALAQAKRVAV